MLLTKARGGSRFLRLRQSVYKARGYASATLEDAVAHETETRKASNFKWAVLPAVPRAKGLARVLGHQDFTALKWVSRCCPELSHNAIEKLFRTRQVRKLCPQMQGAEDESPSLKRVTRKDMLPEGSVLYLPHHQFLLSKEKENKPGETPNVDLKKRAATRNKPDKPTQEDIDWARELVLHMDEHIIAINKPPGLAVQGGVGVGRSLDDLIGPAFSFDNCESPKLVHRLDKDTSGIMVLGRTQESTAILHDMFRAKTARLNSLGSNNWDTLAFIKRKYWALVIGKPRKPEGRIVAALKKVALDGGRSETILIAKDGMVGDVQQAVTEYKVLGPSLYGCTWLELHPLTGRKHQLRVHCAQGLGMPILGDYKYGRHVHESWLSEFAEEAQLIEEHGPDCDVKKKPSTQRLIKGSITSDKPFLHLHSRLIGIPKLKELEKQSIRSGSSKSCFTDSLRLVAPLPPHMKASWTLLPPSAGCVNN